MSHSESSKNSKIYLPNIFLKSTSLLILSILPSVFSYFALSIFLFLISSSYYALSHPFRCRVYSRYDVFCTPPRLPILDPNHKPSLNYWLRLIVGPTRFDESHQNALPAVMISRRHESLLVAYFTLGRLTFGFATLP